jgi:hypothetical protein
LIVDEMMMIFTMMIQLRYICGSDDDVTPTYLLRFVDHVMMTDYLLLGVTMCDGGGRNDASGEERNGDEWREEYATWWRENRGQ